MFIQSGVLAPAFQPSKPRVWADICGPKRF
jgi:hypothetical protein